MSEERRVQTVLSLDLDFFQSEVTMDYHRREEGRVVDDEIEASTECSVVRFFEGKCKLSRRHPIKGLYAQHHDAMFPWLAGLVQGGGLVPPFDLVHVDAHADLGAMNPKLMPLLKKPLIGTTLSTSYIGRDYDMGSVVLAALVCGWVRDLTWVQITNHHLPLETGQIPGQLTRLLRPWKPGVPLEVPHSITATSLSAWTDPCFDPQRREAVPFNVCREATFQLDDPPDYIFFCQSPHYTRKEADALIPVIRAYLDEGTTP